MIMFGFTKDHNIVAYVQYSSNVTNLFTNQQLKDFIG